MMEIEKTPIEGLYILQPPVFRDERGYFFEFYNKEKYQQLGINEHFVQENVSSSVKNTIRGLHLQVAPFAQGKLCMVLHGEVLDVAVDLRRHSATFGKHFSLILSSENKKQLWIPPGFAHGFAALSEEVIFFYKCTSSYNKAAERTLLYSDTQLMIDWGVTDAIVSAKDIAGMSFAEYISQMD